MEKSAEKLIQKTKEDIATGKITIDECEWIIDKETADPENYNMIKLLYEKEIFQLSGLMVELIQKRDRQGLDAKSENLYNWVVKIRKRKAEDRQF